MAPKGDCTVQFRCSCTMTIYTFYSILLYIDMENDILLLLVLTTEYEFIYFFKKYTLAKRLECAIQYRSGRLSGCTVSAT